MAVSKRKTTARTAASTRGVWDFRYTPSSEEREAPERADLETLQKVVERELLPCNWCGGIKFWQELRWPSSFICAACYKEPGEKREKLGEVRRVLVPTPHQQLAPLRFAKEAWDLSAIHDDMEKQRLLEKFGPVTSEEEFSLTEFDRITVGKGQYMDVHKVTKKKLKKT